MNLFTNILGLFCFALYSQTEVFTETVISAQKSLHQENSSGIFYCSTSVDWSVSGVRFVIYNTTNDTQYAGTFFLTNNCTVLSDTKDINYEIDCINKTFFEMVIHNITRQFYHLKMECEMLSNLNDTSTSQSIFFNVPVPVTKAHVVEENNSFIEANENNKTNITCKTSPAFPESRVSWYINNELVTNNVTSTTIKDVGILLITESTLTIKPKRQMNGSHIYCSASNDVDDNVIVKSSISTLLVYYLPTEVTFDINSISVTSVNIINGNSLSLRCNSDSYPNPNLIWTHGDRVVSLNRTLRINDIRETENGNYTCVVSNTLHWNHKAINFNSVIVNVLVPVRSPSLLFNGSSNVITGPIDVIKNDNFSVLCNSNENPLPNYIWDDGNWSSLLTINNIQKDYNNTCTVSNTLVETVGENKTFTRNTSLVVRVLYPPKSVFIQLYVEHRNKTDYLNTNITFEEFKNFNLSCSTVSIPESNYIWNGPVSSKTSLLKMDNVTRNASGEYTCHAFNEMKRTFGKQKIGAANRSIFVEILYAASISRFDLSSLQGDKMVTGTGNGELMTEPGHNVAFNCVVDSNPSSNITVFFRNEILVSNPNRKNLTHRLYNISCDDAGLYHCSGFNDYNRGKVSTKKIAVFVKCPPAPDIGQVKDKVTTLKYVPVTLTFVAREYFDTDDTQFEWQKLSNTSVWRNVRNYSNDDVSVTTKRLQTSLHIPNVTESHTGSYRVVYNNSAGGSIHSFHLNIADIPDAPAKFSAEPIRETAITVTWTRGYNGGLQQVFILQYNRTSQHELENITIHETDEMTFKHTITGLSSGSVYKMILWAKNELGFNKTPQTLVIRTEDLMPPSYLAEGLVGGVVGLIVICLGVAMGLHLHKRLNKRHKARPQSHRLYENIPIAEPSCSTNKDTGNRSESSLSQRVYENLPFKSVHNPVIKEKRAGKTKSQIRQSIDKTSFNEVRVTGATNKPPAAEELDQLYRIEVSELFSHVSSTTLESFESDFKKLPSGLQKPCSVARRPENIALNRYNGIYPYDHSRVRLAGEPDFFMNACYIDGFGKTKAYIASLGPTVKATDGFKTFWKMVWHEYSDIIVMLTNLTEPSGMKCEQYWPDVGSKVAYGKIQVACISEDEFADYTHRSFTVYYKNRTRTVHHLQFTAWPDKRVPEDMVSLIEFRQNIHATPSLKMGPIIVHCSAGIGRTGTLIALDRLIEEGQCKSSVNTFRCVNEMREQRLNMVQTAEQYVYIYKALVVCLCSDSEPIPAVNFDEYVQGNSNNINSKQFQELGSSVTPLSNRELVNVPENGIIRETKDHSGDVQDTKYHVYLYLNRPVDVCGYNDAMYINSFKRKDHFIVARSPTEDTTWDFLCMIYQENCCCIISLDTTVDSELFSESCLLSNKGPVRVRDFIISNTIVEAKEHYTIRKLRINLTGKNQSAEKSVYHFQFIHWKPGDDIPVCEHAFVRFICEVQAFASRIADEESHVLVNSLDGNERSSLFCIVVILMEKMKYENQASILNTVRHFRTRKRAALTSTQQLQFCYQAVSAYINMTD